MQYDMSDYELSAFDQENVYLEQSSKKSKLDMISSFFKKFSSKSVQCDKRLDVVFNSAYHEQEKYPYFVQPPNTTVQLQDFNFATMTLEKAFRVFYKSVDIKLKSTMIHDFACRYFECNPRCIFGTTRVIHLIVSAMITLNTEREISQGAFVQNTMNVIYQHIGRSVQQTKTHRLNAEHLNWLFYNGDDAAFMPHDLSALIFGSIAWQSEIKSVLKNIHTHIQSKPLEEASSGLRHLPDTSLYHDVSSAVSLSSTVSTSNESITPRFMTGLELNIPSRYLKNAPYYKEGILSCKRVLQDNKVIKQSWKTVLAMIENNELYLLVTDTENKESISLKHSIASVLPFGYNRKRPHCFSLKLSDNSVYIFETSSVQETKQWISTCNYWAACTTNNNDTLLDEKKQLALLQAHINTLYSALDKKKRSTSLLREMMKYQIYCNSIESSLALQIKITSFVN